jgi:hypothetical protein
MFDKEMLKMNIITFQEFSQIHNKNMRSIAKFIDKHVDELEQGKTIIFVSNLHKNDIRNVLDVFERENIFGKIKFNIDYEMDMETNKIKKTDNRKKMLFIKVVK